VYFSLSLSPSHPIGTLNGKRGLFPSNYVEVIAIPMAGAPPPPSSEFKSSSTGAINTAEEFHLREQEKHEKRLAAITEYYSNKDRAQALSDIDNLVTHARHDDNHDELKALYAAKVAIEARAATVGTTGTASAATVAAASTTST
jgi:hypothetical protein